jgi:proline iminopeptidase
MNMLRQAGAWLLILLAIPLGAVGGAVALFALVATTGSRIAGAIVGALALVLITGLLSRWGLRVITGARGLRRWVPAAIAGLTLAVVGTVTALLVFSPGAPSTPFHTTGDWEYWDLPTGSRIAYRYVPAQGAPQATPVIMVHGGPGAPEGGLESAVPTLTEIGFDVYQYNQVGAGLSERLEEVAEYTVDRHVDDLEAIRQAIGSDQLILVGESWGGTLIANYLAAHPDRVGRAVVSSPGPIWAPAFENTDGLTASGRRDQDQVIADYPRFMVAHVLLGTVGHRVAHTLLPGHQIDGEFEDLVSSLDLWSGCSVEQHPASGPVRDDQAGVGFWANAMTALDARQVPDPRPALQSVATPLLVLRSECDYRAWEATREYRDLFPNAIMLTVEDAGHVIPNDRPELYQRAVRAFLLDQPLPEPPYRGTEAPW